MLMSFNFGPHDLSTAKLLENSRCKGPKRRYEFEMNLT